ncbi:MAG: aminotransferase class V-fold PLP-dependent enzyme [Deltaproteobacteria bacterium]|nr:aminotransferase class V-fold PLP-dependent enzyme [Deltaproteobacteria bacterium]
MDTASPLDRWALDPAVVHLNHGSFGGCLRTVLDAATAIRARMEAAPMKFFVLEWQDELDRARTDLAAFVGTTAEHLVFVPGATTGVALALAAIELAAGDEVVPTSPVYPACRYQLARLAEARGAKLVFVDVPLPFDPDALIERIAAAITSRTKLALLDHITSPTALVYPLARLIPLFSARSIPVIVDGAHAPGQLPLSLDALGATYYVGNNHKWLCGPKASGFLVARAPLRPLVTSHGANPAYGPTNRLHAELDWSGSYDPAPQLAVPIAIAAVGIEGGGWPAVYARNHALALALRERLGGTLLAPDSSIGTMAALPLELPAGVTPHQLERRLLAEGWEVPIVDFPGQPLVRVSAHLYNTIDQADALGRKLHELGAKVC